MPRVTHNLRVGITLLLLVILSSAPLAATAAKATLVVATAPLPQVIITELQLADTAASEEFVELYNTTDTDIDLADTSDAGNGQWKLQFFSSTKVNDGNPDWTRPNAAVTLTGTIPAYGYYLIAGTSYNPGGIDSDQSYRGRLAESGGGLQLVQTTGGSWIAHDRLLWKKPDAIQSLPESVWPSPTAGSSLQRVPTGEDTYFNADGVLTEFIIDEAISPKDIWQAEVVTVPIIPDSPEQEEVNEDDTPVTDGEDVDAVPPVIEIDNTSLMPPTLTELLPNPAAPLRDETDEYIELYNPNQAAFDLKGYTLEVGTATLHDFTFTESYVLQPLSYTAFYSRDTRLALTNTGSKARLISPDGTILSETLSYTAAGEGLAWTVQNGTWQWSMSATPGFANVLTPPAVPVKTAAAVLKSPTKKATAKKTGTKKAATAKKVKGVITKKAKTTKAKKEKKPAVVAVAQTTEKEPKVPIHSTVLVAVAAAAVLYAAYEYRNDISNRFYKLRQHRAVRFLARKKA